MSWPMYCTPTSAGFCYKCGYYQQSHGALCSHNWIDEEKATRFTLNAIRRRLFKPGVKDRIQECLMRIAEAEAAPEPDIEIANAKQARLSELNGKI